MIDKIKDHPYFCAIKYILHGIAGLFKFSMRVDRADEITIKQRRNICANCHWQYRSKFFNMRKCGECGCFIVPKTAIGKEPCPFNKWNQKMLEFKEQKQPDQFTCWPACLATCTGMDVNEIINDLKTDKYIDHGEQYHSVQEMITYAYTKGIALIEHMFKVFNLEDQIIRNDFAYDLLENNHGKHVILLHTKKTKIVGHVIAGDGRENWFDPSTGFKVGLPTPKLFDLISIFTVDEIVKQNYNNRTVEN